MKCCNECKGENLCDDCNNQVNENKKFKANIILLRRDDPYQFGYMLIYYKL